MADAFAAAIRAIGSRAAAERADPAIDDRCVSYVLEHGAAAARSIVLFHGFTNCPRQFQLLADAFFARGFNVYVPRLPRHGLRDKLTAELAGLTADELTACALESVELGAGLGARVSVLGLSVGGTIAAWLGQTHVLDRAVAVAPFLSIVRVPGSVEPAVAAVLGLAPNLELWWDPRVREKAPPDHAYPRFSTHALAQCLQLGQTVRDLAHAAPPRAARTILVLNAKDPAIDNGVAQELAQQWAAHATGSTQHYVFENLDTRHDIIEPSTYPEAATLVYPVLLPAR
jgi:esterase/lipase